MQIEAIINKYIYTKVVVASLLTTLYNLIILLNYIINIVLFLSIFIKQYANKLQDIYINVKASFNN